ncbi:EF-hand domain-containing protein [Sphingomicrobium sediminis]|uniref:EF-hand domain-containing protein n=1 Tax=Sphingomicrobium sediminis TaxID=2950949 RepID=A0A9X2J2P3_9SPHN|nr:hypothetical protein [Sphingomicrobium sediminis]MCM8557979.1 hypothetical protein [Sphingomicrobium sediminis]
MLVSSIVLAAALQQAQPAQQGPQPITRANYTTQLDARFATLDANANGALDSAELEASQMRRNARVEANARARRAAQFSNIDANKDGVVSLDEWHAAAPQVNLPPVDASAAMARLDSDSDGQVTITEYRSVQLASFDRLDTNNDGVVSPAERQAQRSDDDDE